MDTNIDQLKSDFKTFIKSTVDINRQISVVNPALDFYYNSLNICLGKPGTGKTTLLLKQLMILNNVPNNYELVVYLSNTNDTFFMETVKMFNKIPIVHKTFDEGTDALNEYLEENPERQNHILVIIEDATGLLEGRNQLWEQWIIKLRHLKMTVWINLHDWVGISTKMREQVTCVFLCKGFPRQKCGTIFRQLSVPYEAKVCYGIYSQLRNYQYLKIDNLKNKIKIID